MTDTDDADKVHGRATGLTRRQTLAGLGLGGLFGAGALSTAQQSDDGSGTSTDPWTARRRDKYVRYSDGRFEGLEDYDDENAASEEDRVPLHSVDTVSSLQYLGAGWHPYANPDPDTGDRGAWQFTFVLSNFGLGQQVFTRGVAAQHGDRYDAGDFWSDLSVDHSNNSSTGTVRGRPPRYAPAGFDLVPGLAVQTHSDEEDDGVVDDVAVSARRDLDLFRFLDPQPMVDSFEIDTDVRDPFEDEDANGEGADSLDAVGDRIARTPGDRYADLSAIQRSYADAHENGSTPGGGDGFPILETKGAVENLIGLVAMADKATVDGDEGPRLKRVAKLDEALARLGKVEAAIDVATAALEWWDEPKPVDRDALRYFNGFEQDMPTDDPRSAGAGVVLFDVYVAPGTEGTVEVTSRVDMGVDGNRQLLNTFDDGTLRNAWRIQVAGPDETDPQSLSQGDLEAPEIVDADFEGAPLHVDGPWEEPRSLPITETRFAPREPRPTPSIDPERGVEIEREEVEGVTQEVWTVSEDQSVSFDARGTVRCGSAIEEYRWELCSGTGDDESVVDSASGPDATRFETDVPLLQDADALRVELWVRDADAEVRVQRELDVEGAPPPTPAIETAFEEPGVDQELTFDGSGSSTPANSIEFYAWDVVEMPPAAREAVENAPSYVWSGSGETFSFAPSDPGDYAVSLTITDSRGYVRSDAVHFSVEGSTAVVEPTFDEARAGQSVTFDGSASTVPSGTDPTYEWSVAATPEGASVSPGEASSPTFTFTPPSAGTYAVRLEVAAGDRSDASTQEFAVAPAERRSACADDGNTTSATVDGQTVCDVDGDGLYRDVNADGEVTHVDVREFFSVQHRPTWKQPERFDFNGNEVVGHGDVIAMFEDVATGSL